MQYVSQRLYAGGGKFYAVDNSGNSPDSTEDGPLAVDFSRNAMVQIITDDAQDEPSLQVYLPLTSSTP